MTETQERFLRAITERVPLDRVVEVHLFPSIRQGGAETGMAVIAATSEVSSEGVMLAEEAVGVVADGRGDHAPDADPGAAGEDAVSVDDALTADVVCDATDATDAVDATDGTGDEPARGAPPEPQDDALILADAHPTIAAASDPTPPADENDVAADEADDVFLPVLPASRPEPRHTVFSARYRLTLKGPDRGKWEVDVVAEADAPLVTVELVVRGVRQRSGEPAEPERLDAIALRAYAPVPV